MAYTYDLHLFSAEESAITVFIEASDEFCTDIKHITQNLNAPNSASDLGYATLFTQDTELDFASLNAVFNKYGLHQQAEPRPCKGDIIFIELACWLRTHSPQPCT